MKTILQIQNVSKRFQIQHEGLPYLNFRDKLTTLFKSRQKSEDFWALRDVSFTVQPGESIGIIGRNGAGKSTLLKILSQITPPTLGRIISRGRIASLLEVGTGFHQELSGRENVYMNGSILGMKKSEISSKFEEIIDFAGTEKFLDSPLKYYSSGMQLRLAFAVAAHLEPEILIIDEVLAVGDAEFQRKCLKKMEDVTGLGRTVLFVSHNFAAVKSFCKRGLLIDQGMLVKDDSIELVIDKYNETLNGTEEGLKAKTFWSADKRLNIKQIEVINISKNDESSFCINPGDKWKVKLRLTTKDNYKHFIAALGIISNDGIPIRTIYSEPCNLTEGEYQVDFLNDDIFFGATKYKLILGFSSREQTVLYVDEGLTLEIADNYDKSEFIRPNAKNGFIINKGVVKIS